MDNAAAEAFVNSVVGNPENINDVTDYCEAAQEVHSIVLLWRWVQDSNLQVPCGTPLFESGALPFGATHLALAMLCKIWPKINTSTSLSIDGGQFSLEFTAERFIKSIKLDKPA